MLIHCCGCHKEVGARLTNGKEVYPHRKDLHAVRFYKCDTCENHVGVHKSGKCLPLGVIATREIRNARSHIHRLLDPIWQDYPIRRKTVYNEISKRLGYRYHTAEIKTIEEARRIYSVIKKLRLEIIK